MELKQLIIIGGGNSIQEGINKYIWKKLENTFTIGINYSYRYFQSTCLICMNYTDFYDKNRNDLKQLPMIITVDRPHPSKWEDNTIVVPNESFSLSGILALNLGIELLDEGEIFLLGYDFGMHQGLSHFYQGDIYHRGIAQSQYYTKSHAGRDFNQFEKEEKIKIYNVSLESQIDTFSKISYDTFFKKLNKETYNQKRLRTQIKKRLS